MPSKERLSSSLDEHDTTSGCKTLTSDHEMKVQVPYGYHIDLDFVRYCEKLKNKPYVDRPIRSKRKNRKTMEVMLGLADDPYEDVDKNIKAQAWDIGKAPPPPPDIVNSSEVFQGDFQDAMTDFEETLERSRRKHVIESSIASIDLLNHTPSSQRVMQREKPQQNYSLTSFKYSTFPRTGNLNEYSLGNLKKLGSNSSLSSISTGSSITAVNVPSTCSASQQMGEAITHLLSMSGNMLESQHIDSSNCNQILLQKIRELMSNSFTRMREYEEELKSIPVLKVKLSVVEEEKRLLLKKLRSRQTRYSFDGTANWHLFKESFKDSELSDDDTEGVHSYDDYLVSLSKHRNSSHLRARSASPAFRQGSPGKTCQDINLNMRHRSNSMCDVVSDNNGNISAADHDQISVVRKDLRDVSTLCSVLMRDVGITSMSPNCKTVATETDRFLMKDEETKKKEVKARPCLKCLQQSLKHYEDAATETHATSESLTSPMSPDAPISLRRLSSYSDYLKTLNESSPVLNRLNCASLSPPPLTVDNSCNTDVKVNSHKGQITELLSSEIMNIREHKVLIKSLQDQFDKKIKEQEDTIYQLKDKQAVKNCSNKVVQTDAVKAVKTSSVGINHKPRVKDTSTIIKVDSRDIGVGDASSKAPESDSTLPRLSTISTQTTSICHHKGSGTDVKTTKSRGTDPQQMALAVTETKQTIDLGVETIKVITRDKSVGSVVRTSSIGINVNSTLDSVCSSDVSTPDNERKSFLDNSIHVCDKCNAEIKSVARSFIQTATQGGNAICHNDIVKSTAMSSSATVLSYGGGNQIVTSTLQASKIPRLSPNSASAPKKPSPLRRSASLTYRFNDSTPSSKLPSLQLPFKRVPSAGKSESGGSRPPLLRTDTYTKLQEDRKKSTELMQSMVQEVDTGHKIEHRPSGSGDDKVMRITDIVAKENYPKKLEGRKEPSQEMRGALKVMNDTLTHPSKGKRQLGAPLAIIQLEWFKISSTKDADPKAVEDYLDIFEEYSEKLLHKIVNLTDGNGNTAMHYAVSHGNFDVVSLLLDSKVCDINLQNKAGYTCTMLVSLAHIRSDTHKQVVRRLFQLGDVNIKASQHGQTALMLAVSHGRLDMVRLLVEAGAGINIQDEDGSTALMCAAEHGHLDIVRFLLSQVDTDPTLSDNDGSTALSIAMEASHRDIGVLLYAHMNFSRGSSPYSSVKMKRSRGSTPRTASTPPARTPPALSPGLDRKNF